MPSETRVIHVKAHYVKAYSYERTCKVKDPNAKKKVRRPKKHYYDEKAKRS